jgi:magnesium-transporting ATPase (P-type)
MILAENYCIVSIGLSKYVSFKLLTLCHNLGFSHGLIPPIILIMTIVTEGPFNSSYKLMSTIHEPCGYYDGQGHDGKYIVHVKGAPDQMLALCSNQAKAGNTYTGEPLRTNY